MDAVYKECPQFENRDYILRLVSLADVPDLQKVYADKKSVPFFNGDNCGGDDFYYTTESQMKQAVDFWLFEYQRQGFVRWTIFSKEAGEAVGTIECFHREARDYFTNCGLLRLDIRSDYEVSEKIETILALFLEPTYELFHCDKIATKSFPGGEERCRALKNLGFEPTEEKLIGHDGTSYGNYFVRRR